MWSSQQKQKTFEISQHSLLEIKKIHMGQQEIEEISWS